jgi:hypothetical protein
MTIVPKNKQLQQKNKKWGEDVEMRDPSCTAGGNEN